MSHSADGTRDVEPVEPFGRRVRRALARDYPSGPASARVAPEVADAPHPYPELPNMADPHIMVKDGDPDPRVGWRKEGPDVPRVIGRILGGALVAMVTGTVLALAARVLWLIVVWAWTP